jgi:hypothetical protein
MPCKTDCDFRRRDRALHGDRRNSQLDDWPENPFIGLKQDFPLLDVVVCTTDDGGSTGLLLQELPMIGIGDFRKLLLSLILHKNLQKLYGLDDVLTRQIIRVIHCIFNHRFPSGCRNFQHVVNPLLVVPRHLWKYCPKDLADLLSSFGRYVSPGGGGPVIAPGGLPGKSAAHGGHISIQW